MRIKVEAAMMQDLLIDNLLARDLHGPLYTLNLEV